MLIKLQYSMSKSNDEENEVNLAFNDNSNENEVIMSKTIEKPEEELILEKIEKIEEAEDDEIVENNLENEKFEVENNSNESLEDLLNLEFEHINNNIKQNESIKERNVLEDVIKKEEAKDDESSAIISNKELLSKQQNLKQELGFDNETIIRAYEEEQEKKAIISYEELLKNAQTLRDTFKIPGKEKKTSEVVVNPIEIETTELRVTSYIVEEEFLNTLKKFRLNLK